MARRVRVTINPVADRYHSPNQRIVEFSDPETGQGGLISFRSMPSGELQVALYRLDPKVRVSTEYDPA